MQRRSWPGFPVKLCRNRLSQHPRSLADGRRHPARFTPRCCGFGGPISSRRRVLTTIGQIRSLARKGSEATRRGDLRRLSPGRSARRVSITRARAKVSEDRRWTPRARRRTQASPVSSAHRSAVGALSSGGQAPSHPTLPQESGAIEERTPAQRRAGSIARAVLPPRGRTKRAGGSRARGETFRPSRAAGLIVDQESPTAPPGLSSVDTRAEFCKFHDAPEPSRRFHPTTWRRRCRWQF